MLYPTFRDIFVRETETGSDHHQQEILLDTRSLPSSEHSIKKVLLSHDHRIFSYISEYEGMEVGTLHFRDLCAKDATCRLEEDVLQGVFNFIWAGDGKTVYYTVTNEELRPCKVCRSVEVAGAVWDRLESNVFHLCRS